MTLKGFTFPYKNGDVFVVTDAKIRTETLFSRIINKMNNDLRTDIPDCPEVRAELKYFLRKAKLETRSLSNGRKYYEISGIDFGGRGSFVDEGKTIILKLD